jgi:hypothetical protein
MYPHDYWNPGTSIERGTLGDRWNSQGDKLNICEISQPLKKEKNMLQVWKFMWVWFASETGNPKFQYIVNIVYNL